MLDPVTRELVEVLVKRRLMTRKEAEAMIERERARLEGRLDEARRAAEAGVPAPEPPGTIRVIHLSEVEKQRVREDLRKDVMAQAQAEGWAHPGAVPAWLQRIEIGGDVRMRYELDDFDCSAACRAAVLTGTAGPGNAVPFIDFQAINSGPPFDTDFTSGEQPPWLNTSQDRRRSRLRARLGLAADVTEALHTELRLAIGPDGPVSTNQTAGSKLDEHDLRIDQAYFRYKPLGAIGIDVGRFANPFVSTDLVWDPDLAFDGLSFRFDLGNAFLTAGAFAVGDTDFGFPLFRASKAGSRDKWLYGAQFGTSLGLGAGSHVTLASGYYHFDGIEGELSSRCTPLTSADSCDTDHSRPALIQKGNTLFAIRDVDPGYTQFQYFGLASPFRELAATARVDIPFSGPLHGALQLEVVRNLAFDRRDVRSRGPVNNFEADNAYGGGDTGFLVHARFGHVRPDVAGAWNLALGYRRLETDAVVDAFTDSEFHLGGTNARGFDVGGSIGFTRNGWLTLRWLSATEVSGPPLAVDVYQVDLTARF